MPLLKCCLNGVRTPDTHPALPATPDEVVAAARAAVAAGCDDLHVHPKDVAGRDDLASRHADPVVAALRDADLGVAIGLTTGAWAQPDAAARVEAVTGWSEPPDFASVNWHEEGADGVAAALLRRGVAVEAGLWNLAAVDAFARSPVRDDCFRVLVETVEGQTPATALAQAEAMLGRLSALGVDGPLLHGAGDNAWPVLRRAVSLDLATRIGLEDVLVLPDGTPADDNAALVRAARDLGAGR